MKSRPSWKVALWGLGIPVALFAFFIGRDLLSDHAAAPPRDQPPPSPVVVTAPLAPSEPTRPAAPPTAGPAAAIASAPPLAAPALPVLDPAPNPARLAGILEDRTNAQRLQSRLRALRERTTNFDQELAKRPLQHLDGG
jgi:hypothetical protein